MVKKYIISAFGKDRPGIVADVTKVLYENGCNLEDTRMANLSGEFSLNILFAGPENGDLTETLTAQFKKLGEEKNLSAYVRPVPGAASKPTSMVATHILLVEGLDHTGIVYKISRFLAENQINIENLDSSVTYASQTGAPIYNMKIHIEVTAETAMDVIEAGLGKLADELHVDITIQKSL